MPPAPRLTHFLCIPLVTTSSRVQLEKSLASFREKVTTLRTQEIPNGIPEKAIRPLGTLHLTIGVMSLVTPERVESALKLLGELDLRQILVDSKSSTNNRAVEQVEKESKAKATASASASQNTSLGSKPPPLKVTLKGLLSMHTPSKTSVLYSPPVDEDLRLYSFCQKLRERFTTAELLIPDERPLLLHATIVNTVYVPGQRGKGSGHGKSRARLTIDARELLMDYEDFEWVSDVRVEKVTICRMGQKKTEAGEEEYVVEGEVDLTW